MQAKRHNPPSDTHRRFRGFEGRGCVPPNAYFQRVQQELPSKSNLCGGRRVMAACFYLGKLLLAWKILVLWLKR